MFVTSIAPIPSEPADGEPRLDTATAPGGYISTLGGTGQARLRYVFSWLVAGLWLVGWLAVGCSTASTSPPGDDELVGQPAELRETTDAPPPRPGALWYRIEPTDGELQIHLRLLDPPSTATFFLPGPWAGRGDFDDLVTVDRARSDDSEASLPISVDRREGRIDVETDDGEWLELSYRVELPAGPRPDRRFVPWQNDRGFFAYAPALLVLPSSGIASRLRDIPVEVRTPEDWTVASTWSRTRTDPGDGGRTTGFVADDIRALRDAYLAAGTDWRQHESPLADGRLELTLAGDFAFDDRNLLETTAELTDHYLERFGLYERVSGIAVPAGTGEADALSGTGRHGGFVIEIPEGRALDDDVLVVLAHEALHMWNGHKLVPDSEAEDQTRWFKEGLTHYLAVKTLARLGLIDPETVREQLARAGRYYLHNPAIAGGRIRTIDRTRLPYDRGLLIALALDLQLLEATDGAVTLEDWLTSLLSSSHADRADQYDSGLLRRSFESLTRDTTDAPIRRYDRLVTRQQRIDVAGLFERLGLHYIDARGDERARLLPIDGATEPFERLFGSPNPTEDDGHQ